MYRRGVGVVSIIHPLLAYVTASPATNSELVAASRTSGVTFEPYVVMVVIIMVVI